MEKLFFLVAVMLYSSMIQAQVILTFEFAGISGDEVDVNSNFNDANLTYSTISRGVGLTPAANADRYNATGWSTGNIANAVSGNDYMEFTVAPNSGYTVAISSIVVYIQRSTTGFTAIALRNSMDNYASNVDTEKTVADNTSTQSFTFAFTQPASAVPVTYRLYGYAEVTNGSSGIGDFSGNDIVVHGVVAAIVIGSLCTEY